MKKIKLILAITFTVFIGLMGGIGTYAYFSDSALSDTQTFTAGTVDINVKRDKGDPVPGPMFYTTLEEGKTIRSDESVAYPYHPTGYWYPGKGQVTRTLIVENNGSLDANIDGISAEISGVDAELAAKFAEEIIVEIKPLGSEEDEEIIYNGLLSGLTSGKVTALNSLPISAESGEWYINFTITMHEDAGNDLQGISPKVAFYIYASQVK